MTFCLSGCMQQATSTLFWTIHGNKPSLFVTEYKPSKEQQKIC